MRLTNPLRPIVLIVVILFSSPCALLAKEEKSIRVGFFPNLTHAQPLVGLARGSFQARLGADVKIDTKLFNAGPALMEAVFAGGIDIGYIGPGPMINGFIRSGGEIVRMVAGAASGGAVFVVRQDVKVDSPKDLEGKTLASPQLGNTQDISLRIYLRNNGLKPKGSGGNVGVIPIHNPDIMNLFREKQIDGAWVPEPWGARLVRETGGRGFLDERDLWQNKKFATASIIVTTGFLLEYPELVEKWLRAHVEVTEWINAHPEEAKEIINAELKRITTKGLPKEILNEAFGRVEFTYEPLVESINTFADYAYELGFLRQKPDLSNLYQLDLLNKVLTEDGLGPITAVTE